LSAGVADASSLIHRLGRYAYDRKIESIQEPMKCSKATPLIIFALASVALQPVAVVFAAEIRGTVSIDYQGLFERSGAMQGHPVSVALLPAEGQRSVPRGIRRHRIEIVANRMRPAFLTVQKGDYIEFMNRDNVYHELFSLSPGEPVTARLGKADSGEQAGAAFRLDQTGTTHFFCRIHNKSYARIDVVATPYIQMVEPGGQFQFVGIAPGRWRLRLAAPAAETEWVDVAAVTAPPPLHFTLTSRSGGQGANPRPGPGTDVGMLYGRPVTQEHAR
jgi:plastocyanin